MNTRFENDNRMRKSNMESFWLCMIIILCFLPHLFSYAASMTLFIVLLAVTILFFVFSDLKIRIERSGLSVLWLLSIAVAIISLLLSSRSRTAIFDVITLFLAMLLVIFHNNNPLTYHKGIKLIFYISLIFAFGILLEITAPSLYKMILNNLPSNYENAVLNSVGDLERSRIKGFTPNAGSSASFIIAGLVSYVSLFCVDFKIDRSNRIKKTLVIAFLILMVLFTGKRGPVVFLLISFLARYIIPSKGNERIMKYGTIIMIVLFASIAISFFSPLMTGIPIIGSLINTFAGLIAGEDVSSSRFGLYAWAWKLFKQNPLFGIGWGNYRFTTVGNVTRISALDAHNIYLQLLCETGIIGFFVFLLLFIVFWKKTKDALVMTIAENDTWKPLVSFSFTYQTFFLLYGLTGNPLYDQHFQMLYALSCAILPAYLCYKREAAINNGVQKSI